jgi:hypothetical protein
LAGLGPAVTVGAAIAVGLLPLIILIWFIIPFFVKGVVEDTIRGGSDDIRSTLDNQGMLALWR